MKVVVFGCQQIAVDFIKYLNSRSDVKLPLVITYELPLDKTYGYDSVLRYCKRSKVKVTIPKLISDSIIDTIKVINPDIIFSIYFRKILPKAILNIPRLGCINIHPSLLPEYRGPVPTAWAILNGEVETGITIHLMDENIDTGNLLVQKKISILEDETGYELYTKAMKIGAEQLIANFDRIINKEIIPQKQQGIGSYFGKMESKHRINWKNTQKNIINQIRVHSKPYNPAETIMFNRYVIVNKARPIIPDGYIAQIPGRIIDVLDNDDIIVSCADGCVLLYEYEIAPRLNETEKDVYLRPGNSFV